MLNELKSFLSLQLKEELPGKTIQYQMASSQRINDMPNINELRGYKESAVCILFYKENGTIYFPLIERVVYKGVHSGQIALPGGKKDEGDISIEHTALRELQEEIGINIDKVEIIGKISNIYIQPSNFLVHPFIGITEGVPTFIANPTEVQNIISFSLNELMNEELIKETILEFENGIKIKTPYFDVRGNILWGATAMILNELKHILKSSPSSFQFQ